MKPDSSSALLHLIPRWRVSCSTCPWRPSPLTHLADQQWTQALTGCCQTSEIKETVWDTTSYTKMIRQGQAAGLGGFSRSKTKKSEEVINVKMLENCSGHETKSTTLLLGILFCSSLVSCYQESRKKLLVVVYIVHINEHTMCLVRVKNRKLKSLNSFQALLTSLTLFFQGCSWIKQGVMQHFSSYYSFLG